MRIWPTGRRAVWLLVLAAAILGLARWGIHLAEAERGGQAAGPEPFLGKQRAELERLAAAIREYQVDNDGAFPPSPMPIWHPRSFKFDGPGGPAKTMLRYRPVGRDAPEHELVGHYWPPCRGETGWGFNGLYADLSVRWVPFTPEQGRVMAGRHRRAYGRGQVLRNALRLFASEHDDRYPYSIDVLFAEGYLDRYALRHEVECSLAEGRAAGATVYIIRTWTDRRPDEPDRDALLLPADGPAQWVSLYGAPSNIDAAGCLALAREQV